MASIYMGNYCNPFVLLVKISLKALNVHIVTYGVSLYSWFRYGSKQLSSWFRYRKAAFHTTQIMSTFQILHTDSWGCFLAYNMWNNNSPRCTPSMIYVDVLGTTWVYSSVLIRKVTSRQNVINNTVVAGLHTKSKAKHIHMIYTCKMCIIASNSVICC